jgi:hypothetical protein
MLIIYRPVSKPAFLTDGMLVLQAKSFWADEIGSRKSGKPNLRLDLILKD